MSKVNWQEVFDGPARRFTEEEKDSTHWGL